MSSAGREFGRHDEPRSIHSDGQLPPFRRFFDAFGLCAFHSPQPRILSPVESTIRSIGASWARVRGGTATIWFRRKSVVWSGALRSRPIKRSSEFRNPSAWRSGRPRTTRSVNAVRIARFEYRCWPPPETVLRWYPRSNCLLDLHDGPEPRVDASVAADTNSCTNAIRPGQVSTAC